MRIGLRETNLWPFKHYIVILKCDNDKHSDPSDYLYADSLQQGKHFATNRMRIG